MTGAGTAAPAQIPLDACGMMRRIRGAGRNGSPVRLPMSNPRTSRGTNPRASVSATTRKAGSLRRSRPRAPRIGCRCTLWRGSKRRRASCPPVHSRHGCRRTVPPARPRGTVLVSRRPPRASGARATPPRAGQCKPPSSPAPRTLQPSCTSGAPPQGGPAVTWRTVSCGTMGRRGWLRLFMEEKTTRT